MEKNINAVTKVLQPFKMEILPIRKLVLFNFEKAPDEIYSGLELQYLINNEVEKGYRLIMMKRGLPLNKKQGVMYVEKDLSITKK